jgi:hypothetical protein
MTRGHYPCATALALETTCPGYGMQGVRTLIRAGVTSEHDDVPVRFSIHPLASKQRSGQLGSMDVIKSIQNDE